MKTQGKQLLTKATCAKYRCATEKMLQRARPDLALTAVDTTTQGASGEKKEDQEEGRSSTI